MNLRHQQARHLTRRHFLRDCNAGLGGLALGMLLGEDARAAPADEGPLAPRPPHFRPRARNVIYLHMAGSPPQHDLFDYKPALVAHHGKPCPDEFYKGRRFAFTKGRPNLLGTPRTFKQHGANGMWISDALPYLSTITDELTFVRSLYTDQFNHAPAQLLMYTGSPRQGRPSMGTWVTYGLGSESRNLPGFMVLLSGGTSPSAGKGAWSSGFLPSVYQGVQCRSKGDPVLYVSNPEGMDRKMRRASLDALRDLNELQAQELGNPETLTRIAQYELAYRMQISVPEVMDISREPRQVIEDYGAQPGGASFANNCLLARRLVEQGVRFVQLFDWGWDFHGTNKNNDIRGGLTTKCGHIDRPITALILDLKARGLLDETLIVWSGEFGRTPFREGRTAKKATLGRDHYPNCFTIFLAGGGTKRGLIYGETDELGFSVADKPVHVHDLQATLLHLLGMDHKKLTTRFQGRDYRLTDVHGNVVRDLMA